MKTDNAEIEAAFERVSQFVTDATGDYSNPIHADLADMREALTVSENGAKLRLLNGQCATVHEITETYLVANGYDGVWNSDECGCKIGDLAPCGMGCMEYCRPGFIQPDGTVGPEKQP